MFFSSPSTTKMSANPYCKISPQSSVNCTFFSDKASSWAFLIKESLKHWGVWLFFKNFLGGISFINPFLQTKMMFRKLHFPFLQTARKVFSFPFFPKGKIFSKNDVQKVALPDFANGTKSFFAYLFSKKGKYVPFSTRMRLPPVGKFSSQVVIMTCLPRIFWAR